MFVEALTFAHTQCGKFHSWTHGPRLREWPKLTPPMET